jgi:hypothetical protein
MTYTGRASAASRPAPSTTRTSAATDQPSRPPRKGSPTMPDLWMPGAIRIESTRRNTLNGNGYVVTP